MSLQNSMRNINLELGIAADAFVEKTRMVVLKVVLEENQAKTTKVMLE